jgi:hypothetical protein
MPRLLVNEEEMKMEAVQGDFAQPETTVSLAACGFLPANPFS